MKHRISQLDGFIESSSKEDVGVQTEDSLSLTLVGRIAEDCEEEYIGETFWDLQDGFFFDHWYTEAGGRAPEVCWVNKKGVFRNKIPKESCGKVT